MNVTDKQIRALRSEAVEAGDLAQIVVCDRALGGTDTADDYMPPDPWERRAFRRAIGMTQNEAREECERVIADAKAQGS